jgi:hypothetical protein
MAKEFGPDCVKSSKYVGQDVGSPMPEGILGKPLAKGTTTMTAKASDNSAGPGFNHDLNMKADAARRSGTVFMPKGSGR